MHGFRVLTAGVDLSDFEKNPVMLWMHERADGTADKMPIGFWDELKHEGDEITGVPNFDDNDPVAMKLYHKVEHGTIRAASAGIIPVQLSNDPKDMLEGQKLPTYKKSKMKEASLVDIGSNGGAVALYNPDGQLVTLSAGSLPDHFKNLLNTQNQTMKIETLSAPAILALLKLDDATEAEALAEVQRIVTLAAKQETEITTLKAKVVEFETMEKEAKITALVDKAIGDRKILPAQKEGFTKLAAADFDETKKLLEGMKASPELSTQVKTEVKESDKSEVAELTKLSFDELFATGKLEKLKALDFEAYSEKFKAKFNKEPNKQ